MEAMKNDDGVIMCSVCPDKRAVAMYQWQWGEKGYCSQDGQALLNQQAANLKQKISYLPLVQGSPEPLKRDERTRLIAEKLSAESERDEVLERNSRLYAQNTDLGQNLTTAKLRIEVLEEQIFDTGRELQDVKNGLAKEAVINGKLMVELQKANTLLEAGPGEEALEIKSLREQNERLQKVEETLRRNLDEASAQRSEAQTAAMDAIKGLLKYEQDEAARALLETELRRLGGHVVG